MSDNPSAPTAEPVFAGITPYELLMSRLSYLAGQVVTLAIFGTLVVFAVVSIGEITARVTALHHINSEINSLAAEIAARPPQTGGITDAKVEADDPDRRKLAGYRFLRMMISAVDASGTNSRDIDAVAGAFRFLQGPFTDAFDITKGRPPSDSVDSFFSAISDRLTWFRSLRSETLLALAVIMCGAIGAITAGLRKKEFTTFHDLLLGVSAGFIVYLALKGAKFVFILQADMGAIPMNPYGSAFAGLLAGLFTERAYNFLSGLIDEFTSKIQKAFKT